MLDDNLAVDNRTDNQRYGLGDSGFEGLGSLEGIAAERVNASGRDESNLFEYERTNLVRQNDLNSNQQQQRRRELKHAPGNTGNFNSYPSPMTMTKEQSSSMTLSESAINEFNRRGRYPTSSQMMSKWLFDQQMSLVGTSETHGKNMVQ